MNKEDINSLRSLARVAEGESVELARINSGHDLKSRLASMGLVPGVVFKLIKNDNRGPFIIALKGSRVVLGRGMADRIEVK